MAITATVLDSGGNTFRTTPQFTAGLSPTANKLILVSIHSRDNSSVSPNQPTLTGCGITWAVAKDILYSSSGTDRGRITVFRGFNASPTSGQLQIAWSGGTTPQSYSRIITEWTGVDTSAGAGADGIIQSTNGSGIATSASATLSSFANAANACFAAIGELSASADLPTVTGGMTVLSEVDLTSPASSMENNYKANLTTPGWTWTGSNPFGYIALELASLIHIDSGLLDFRLTAQATDIKTQDLRITAQNITNTTRDIRVVAQDFTNRTQDTRTTGEPTSFDIQVLRLVSQDFASRLQDLKLIGERNPRSAVISYHPLGII